MARVELQRVLWPAWLMVGLSCTPAAPNTNLPNAANGTSATAPLPMASASSAPSLPAPEAAKNSDGSARALPPSPPDEPDFTLVLRYDDFGPQAAANKLLGPEWYSWTQGGGFEPGDRFDVRIVVFAGLTPEQAKERYPTQRGEGDHRVVSLEDALRYLDDEIRGLASVDPTEDATLVSLRQQLETTRLKIVTALGEPMPLVTTPARPKPKSIPLVRSSTTMVGPKFPPELFQRVILSHRAELARCIMRHAADAPSSLGTLRFTVDTNSAVSAAEYVDQGVVIRPNDLQSCVLRVIRRMTFPAAEGGPIIVTYPLNLSPT